MRPVLFLLVFSLLSLPVAGFAASQAVHYEVYAGGIHALSADLDIERGKKDYRVIFNAKPYGVIGSLLPWGGVYDTKGQIVKNDFYRSPSKKSASGVKTTIPTASFIKTVNCFRKRNAMKQKSRSLPKIFQSILH